eukprot:gene18241-biopygen5398
MSRRPSPAPLPAREPTPRPKAPAPRQRRSRSALPPSSAQRQQRLWLAVGQRALTTRGDAVTIVGVPAAHSPSTTGEGDSTPLSYSVLFADGRTASLPDNELRRAAASRVYCPVPQCPCSDARKHQGWASVSAMTNHLKAHSAGLIEGRLPDAWMRDHDKIFCPMCGMICAARNQCCTHCWPQRRAAAEASSPMAGT